MNPLYTPREWLARVEWEGGVIGGLEYGLGAASIDPDADDGANGKFRALVAEAEALFARLAPVVAKIEEFDLPVEEPVGIEVDEV